MINNPKHKLYTLLKDATWRPNKVKNPTQYDLRVPPSVKIKKGKLIATVCDDSSTRIKVLFQCFGSDSMESYCLTEIDMLTALNHPPARKLIDDFIYEQFCNILNL